METITREEKIMSGENLTPITREEMFLAKAAGQDVETPTPITRREMFLSKINGSGGGGSGGGDSSKFFLVSITQTYDENIDDYVTTADKTREEIMEALNTIGVTVVGTFKCIEYGDVLENFTLTNVSIVYHQYSDGSGGMVPKFYGFMPSAEGIIPVMAMFHQDGTIELLYDRIVHSRYMFLNGFFIVKQGNAYRVTIDDNGQLSTKNIGPM